jgi:hypothetical protein
VRGLMGWNVFSGPGTSRVLFRGRALAEESLRHPVKGTCDDLYPDRSLPLDEFRGSDGFRDPSPRLGMTTDLSGRSRTLNLCGEPIVTTRKTAYSTFSRSEGVQGEG